ncbi:MAG: hypothetical protein II715_02520 [Clostridia bacterium]|nr:hypothetical protein [Clostridia bacterium]
MLNIGFVIEKGKSAAVQPENGHPACEIAYDGKLTVSLFFDFCDRPLVLCGVAKPGDSAEVRIRPYRLELYVNGSLCDEEWPCGQPFLVPSCVFEGNIKVIFEDVPETAGSGCETGCPRKGISAGEIRKTGVNIGDCMPYTDPEGDGTYHLFYLYDRHHHCSKWGFGAHQWAHVSTKDFVTWDEHPTAVPITEEWEGSICTGSVCRGQDGNGKDAYFAWYAVRMTDLSPARITYARSYDLERFEKSMEWFCMPEGYEPTTARDPKVFFADGKYHMFVTTTRVRDGKGCLAHLVNGRMSAEGWKDEGAIRTFGDASGSDEMRRNNQPECPDYFRMGDYYYLVFGLGGKGYYAYSKEPYGAWTFPREIIPCGNVPKSASLSMEGKSRRIFCGFICEEGYAGSLCAAEAFQLPDGKLRFEKLELGNDRV